MELRQNAAVNHAVAQWYREKGRLPDALEAIEKKRTTSIQRHRYCDPN